MAASTISFIPSSLTYKCSHSLDAISTIHPPPPSLLRFPSPATKTRGIHAAPSGRTPTRGSALHGSQCAISDAFRKRERGLAAESTSEGAASQPLSTIDEEDRVYVDQIFEILDRLRIARDMTPQEVRLTIMIEDPREVERRRQLGIEDERGCSRDDMANALLDVYEGRIPEDRAVLRELAKEMSLWPGLEDDASSERRGPKQSLYAKVTDTGVDPAIAAQRARVDWDAATKISSEDGVKDIGETLPPVFGFSLLYLVSIIPIVFGIGAVVILFVNSLQ